MSTEDIKRILNHPYPYLYKGMDLMRFCLIIFGMALFFNYIIKPFDNWTPEHKFSYFWISFIHSLTPIPIILLTAFVLSFQRSNGPWRIKNELIAFFTFILITGIAQFFIRDLIYDNDNNWSLKYLFEEIRNTFWVGVVFLGLLIPININRMNAKKIGRLEDQNDIIHLDKPSQNLIHIKTSLKNDDFAIDAQQFLFAKAEGNYVVVYIKHGEVSEKLLKRLSIKDLEIQLSEYAYIIKTHRSYLANLHNIKELSSNNQGYKLTFLDEIEPAFVSRNSVVLFDNAYKTLRKSLNTTLP